MFRALPGEGEGRGGVLKRNQQVEVCFDVVLAFKTPSQPPPSQGEEQTHDGLIIPLWLSELTALLPPLRRGGANTRRLNRTAEVE
ncbi:hypothetical protein A9993_07875 [Rahnella victoriana]|nr:hypothetical protein A9993_07875 [Rahnella victoriana]